MNTPRMQVFALAAVLMVASCANSGTPSSASRISPSASPAVSTSIPSPSPSPSASQTASAFCLDLTTFQIAVVAFRSDVGMAIQGQPLDFKEVRRKAKIIANYGKEMRESAPPDIAEHFAEVLDAVATSTRRLKPGAKTRDVVDPLYGKRHQAAFDAVNQYECH